MILDLGSYGHKNAFSSLMPLPSCRNEYILFCSSVWVAAPALCLLQAPARAAAAAAPAARLIACGHLLACVASLARWLDFRPTGVRVWLDRIGGGTAIVVAFGCSVRDEHTGVGALALLVAALTAYATSIIAERRSAWNLELCSQLFFRALVCMGVLNAHYFFPRRVALPAPEAVYGGGLVCVLMLGHVLGCCAYVHLALRRRPANTKHLPLEPIHFLYGLVRCTNYKLRFHYIY